MIRGVELYDLNEGAILSLGPARQTKLPECLEAWARSRGRLRLRPSRSAPTTVRGGGAQRSSRASEAALPPQPVTARRQRNSGLFVRLRRSGSAVFCLATLGPMYIPIERSKGEHQQIIQRLHPCRFSSTRILVKKKYSYSFAKGRYSVRTCG
jgi:hypothetical protein